MTTRQLIQTVALGLSLAMVSLTPAYGATGRVVSAAEMQASRKRLMAHQQSVEKQKQIHEELSGALRAGHGADDAFEALHSHHQAVSNSDRLLRLLGNDGDAIEMDQRGTYIAKVNGAERRAEVADLLRHGVDSRDKLMSAVHEQVVKLAEVPGKHTDQAVLNEAIEKLNQRATDAKNLAWEAAHLPDLKFLEWHHNSVLVPKGISSGEEVALEGGLAFQDEHLLDKKTSDEPTYQRLAELGAGSTAKFEQLLGRVLVKKAGVKGDPLKPKVVERARATLRREMAEVSELKAIIANPEKEQPDLKLLWQVHKSMAERDNVEVRPIVLATSSRGSESIEVIGDSMYLVERDSHNAVTSQNEPTLADLHRFDLDSKFKFRQAVGRAMDIAQEDLNKVTK